MLFRLVLRLLLPLLLMLAVMKRTTALSQSEEKQDLSHLYCQPLSEAILPTPMIGRLVTRNMSIKLDGKCVRVVSAPWPSIVGRKYWIDASWDSHWFLFHEDAALMLPGRPDEGELERESTEGLVKGLGVATVRIIPE